ncbi:MAG: dTMP kinase [Oscillospiraceae bacterium]|nr:dTMP kinase [Oscillospiraceae bacterium]
MKKGTFIVFEGLDGSGKTTQLKSLHTYITKEKGIKCKEEREPSEGLPGALARGAIKRKMQFEPHTMALLFAADRYEHIKHDIQPYLDKGIHVICDRYVLSNFAYQGLACDFDSVYEYNKAAMSLLMPNLTVFIDTEPEESAQRMEKSRIGDELFDKDGVLIRQSFYNAIDFLTQKGFLEVFDKNNLDSSDNCNKSKLVIIKGNQSEIELTAEIIKLTEPFLR